MDECCDQCYASMSKPIRQEKVVVDDIHGLLQKVIYPS